MKAHPQTFDRLCRLFGYSTPERLKNVHVMVCGLGAVGSFALEALARSGIATFTIVDADRVDPSNINRQLFALNTTIGLNKTDVATERISAINPDVKISAHALFLTPENIPELLDAVNPDIVIDAIDTFPAKPELLAECVRRKLPVFSSMGAARKTNPALLKVADISKTTVCPLAKSVRMRLKACGCNHDVRCVFSTETALPTLGEIPEELNKPGVKPPLGSFIAVTGTVGLMLAAEVIKMLLNDSKQFD